MYPIPEIYEANRGPWRRSPPSASWSRTAGWDSRGAGRKTFASWVGRPGSPAAPFIRLLPTSRWRLFWRPDTKNRVGVGWPNGVAWNWIAWTSSRVDHVERLWIHDVNGMNMQGQEEASGPYVTKSSVLPKADIPQKPTVQKSCQWLIPIREKSTTSAWCLMKSLQKFDTDVSESFSIWHFHFISTWISIVDWKHVFLGLERSLRSQTN